MHSSTSLWWFSLPFGLLARFDESALPVVESACRWPINSRADRKRGYRTSLKLSCSGFASFSELLAQVYEFKCAEWLVLAAALEEPAGGEQANTN